MSSKQSGVCLSVECRGGVVVGAELDPNLMPLLFFCFSFVLFFLVLCIKQLLETKTTCSASYGKEKTPSLLIHPAPVKKPSTQVSLV